MGQCNKIRHCILRRAQCSVNLFLFAICPHKCTIKENGTKVGGFAYTDEQQESRWGSLILESIPLF